MIEEEPKKLAGTDMLLVSAVALIDRDGRVLMAQRPEGTNGRIMGISRWQD